MIIYYNQNLSNYNSFKVYGNVKKVFFIENKEDLFAIDYKKIIQKKGVILGKGTNILFLNLPEEIYVINFKGIKIKTINKDYVRLFIKAGEILDEVIEFCINNKFCGLENLSGIPGTVGGAIVGNSGAFGREISDFVIKVIVFSLKEKKFFTFNKNDCLFDYRNSLFKNNPEFVIYKVEIELKKYKTYNFLIENEHLKNILKDKVLDLQIIRNSILKLRNDKLPNYEKLGNAGSFFKNVLLPYKKLRLLKMNFKDLPYHKISNDKYKIPTAWLLEKLNLKGIIKGNVCMYEKNPLIIINLGNATGKEIYNFTLEIKNEFSKKLNIILEEEVIIF